MVRVDANAEGPDTRRTATRQTPVTVVERLIERLAAAYGSGDIEALMALFHEQARVGNRPRDKTATRADYVLLFATTLERRIEILAPRIRNTADGIAVNARYKASVVRRDDGARRNFTGRLCLTLTKSGDDYLIRRMVHSQSRAGAARGSGEVRCG